MTSIEQHKMIAALCDYERRMTRDEMREFEMFRKRDKDDEDLDNASRKRVTELYEKYVVKPRPAANPLDALFKKP
jgi:hypothetical protein